MTTLDYETKPVKRARRAHFWRAARYLGPYRRTVVKSILCAVFAGGVFFSGLGALLPVLNTLLNGDSPRTWVDRMVAEQRWGIDLADDPDRVRVLVNPHNPQAWLQNPGKRSLSGWAAIPSEATPGEGYSFLADAPIDQVQINRFDETGDADDRFEDGWKSVEGTQFWGAKGLGPFPEYPIPLHLRLLRRAVYLLPASPVGAVAVLMFGIFLLSILANTVRYFQEFLSNRAALSAVNDVRRDCYESALRAPMGYFDSGGTGDVTSRITTDCGQLQEGLRTLLGRGVMEPVLAAFALAFALWIDWRLTLFVIVFAPIMIVVLKKFGTKMRRASRASLQHNAALLGQIESTLGGVRVVKAANAEAFEVNRLRGILDRLLFDQMRLVRYDAMSAPVMETLAVLAVGVVITVAVYLVRVDQSLSAAAALAVFGALIQIAESLRRVSKLNVVLAKADAAGQRVFEAVDFPGEGGAGVGGTRRGEGAKAGEGRRQDLVSAPESSFSPSRPFASSPLRVHSGLAFEDVTFRYRPDQPPAVDGVSLSVRKGESVAVVGRNGSGKTTLLSLLPRFHDPEAGRITIDETDVRDVPLRELRELIGVVTQEAVVFPGTVHENIAYARPGATRDEVEAAARQAEAHGFITAKPGGYDFELTGLGGQLSGGQRQRLNIARAILRDPPVLILDEATSQVDAESEHLIQQAVSRLMKGRTTFVIAHRFSTILDCDRIALMDSGRLAAVGRHAELLETSGLYRTLYDRQLVAA